MCFKHTYVHQKSIPKHSTVPFPSSWATLSILSNHSFGHTLLNFIFLVVISIIYLEKLKEIILVTKSSHFEFHFIFEYIWYLCIHMFWLKFPIFTPGTIFISKNNICYFIILFNFFTNIFIIYFYQKIILRLIHYIHLHVLFCF